MPLCTSSAIYCQRWLCRRLVIITLVIKCQQYAYCYAGHLSRSPPRRNPPRGSTAPVSRGSALLGSPRAEVQAMLVPMFDRSKGVKERGRSPWVASSKRRAGEDPALLSPVPRQGTLRMLQLPAARSLGQTLAETSVPRWATRRREHQGQPSGDSGTVCFVCVPSWGSFGQPVYRVKPEKCLAPSAMASRRLPDPSDKMPAQTQLYRQRTLRHSPSLASVLRPTPCSYQGKAAKKPSFIRTEFKRLCICNRENSKGFI